jgi:ribosomal protein S12 methylthiotransferase accessory factor
MATHPNPEVAIVMALCEAAQTRAANVAGSREDLALKARSLGRHERTRAEPRSCHGFWSDVDAPRKLFSSIDGATFSDSKSDLLWIMERLREAGIEHLIVVDMTVEEIAPARAVRVIIPRLETPNPFYSGNRARATMLRDLLPVPLDMHWPSSSATFAGWIGR